MLVFAALLVATTAAPAWAQTAPAQTIWRLLDYIAVDYPGAVNDAPDRHRARIDLLGPSPTIQSVLAQLAAIAAISLGIWYNRRKASSASVS